MASLVYGTLTRLFGNISFRNCNSLTQYAKIATEATTSTSTDGKLENETKEQQQSNQFRDQINAGVYGRALFPTVDTHTNLVIDSVPFKNLHILHIKSSKNNTILSVTDNLGKVLFLTSSGSNGFKNAKKSTTTAAQAAALTMSDVSLFTLKCLLVKIQFFTFILVFKKKAYIKCTSST